MKSEYRPLKSLVRRKIGYGIVQPGKDNVGEVHLIKVNNIISGLKNIEDLDRTTSEIEKKYERTRLKGGELVISVVGTPGRTAIVPKSFAGCNLVRAVALIDIVDCLTSWVKYYIDSPNGQNYILQNLNTTVQPTLNIKDLSEMPILIMDRKKMESIVSILSAIDRKIEFNNRINENLELQAQAIFKSWFVDFEPFGGVMPVDWNVGAFSDVADVLSGKRPPMKQNDKTEDASIPLIGAAAIMGYTNKFNHDDKILVIGRVGTHGIVQRFDYPCWTSDNTLVIKSNYYEYTYQILKLIDYKAMNRGSTQPLITQGDLKKTEIIIPSKECLQKYENIVGSLMYQYSQNRTENEKLALLRDTLLPKLMNGEIDVSKVRI